MGQSGWNLKLIEYITLLLLAEEVINLSPELIRPLRYEIEIDDNLSQHPPLFLIVHLSQINLLNPLFNPKP